MPQNLAQLLLYLSIDLLVRRRTNQIVELILSCEGAGQSFGSACGRTTPWSCRWSSSVLEGPRNRSQSTTDVSERALEGAETSREALLPPTWAPLKPFCGALGAVLAALGRLWGSSGAVLALPGQLLAAAGSSRTAPGPSWMALAASLDRF